MLVPAYLKKSKFFIFFLLIISYATMKFWWQCEDSSMRRAVLGWQWHDVIFELSSFTVQYKCCWLLPRYVPLPCIGNGKFGVLFCVASWLTFDCYNQQYTYRTTLMMSVEVIFFAIMLIPAYLKKSKFFIFLLLTISYATMKFWW